MSAYIVFFASIALIAFIAVFAWESAHPVLRANNNNKKRDQILPAPLNKPIPNNPPNFVMTIRYGENLRHSAEYMLEARKAQIAAQTALEFLRNSNNTFNRRTETEM